MRQTVMQLVGIQGHFYNGRTGCKNVPFVWSKRSKKYVKTIYNIGKKAG